MALFRRQSEVERALRGGALGAVRPGPTSPVFASASDGVARGLAGSAARAPRGARRAYQAAAVSRLTASFPGVFGTGDSEIRVSLRRVRGRARQLAQDSDYTRRFLKLLKQNVIGPNGIRLKMLVRDPESAKPDTEANRIIEEAWRRQCERDRFTVTGNLHAIEAQELYVESVARDGEIFGRKVVGAPNPSRFAIQMLEADMVDDELDRVLSRDRVIRMGIEYDRWDRPRAYWLRRRHPGEYGAFGLYTAATDHERVDAEAMLHGFVKERPTQSRGMPWYASTALGLDMMAGAEESELIASRLSASKMGFYKTPSGYEYEGDDEDEKGPITDVEPGIFEELPADWSFETFDPQHPTTAFAPFLKHIRQRVSSGFNLSYFLIANDGEGLTYSTGRLFHLNDRDFFRALHGFVARTLLQPYFEAWLTVQLTTGLLPLPPRKLDAYLAGARWRGRGWAWVDPQKEAAGNREAYELGVTSLTAIAGEQGRDIEEIAEERAYELEVFAEKGLEAPKPRGAAAPAPKAAAESDDEPPSAAPASDEAEE